MKYILSFLLLVCMPFLAFSQIKALEKAVKKGKNPENGTFFVEFDKYYDVSDVNQWFNNHSYTVWEGTKIEFPVYGDAKVVYRRIYFMTSEDYAFVQAEKRRIEEEQRRNSRGSSISSENIALGLTFLATLWGLKKGVEYGLKNSGSSYLSPPNNAPSNCQTFASVSVNVVVITENQAQLTVSGPEYVNIELKKGKGTNDVAKITANYKLKERCIAGSYSFTYSWNMGTTDAKSFSGTFEMDGKHSDYVINIQTLLGSPTFTVNAR